MQTLRSRLIVILTLSGLALSACALPTLFASTSAATPAPAACATNSNASACALPTGSGPAAGAGQPALVHGKMAFSNDIILKYYVEHAVALVDMHGFVTRDERWEIPVTSQTLGYLKLDEKAMTGEYQLQLPARPEAVADDVDNDGQKENGVQTFAVSYWPNLYGDPYSAGDDKSRGWPSYLASVKTDPENNDEVVGGKLVVWAPDAAQSYPTGFGDDGLLFTKDDPSAPLPAGYSIVDLDQKPFAVTREEDADLTLYEPADVAVKDFSNLSFTEAFKKMFDLLKKEYAFSDQPGKAPDWDKVWADVQPKVAEAEANGDAKAFYEAVATFTYAFHDGHVSVNGGDYAGQVFREKAAGGLGFAARELDDGRVMVNYVAENGPAAGAGMQVGAIVTKFNNQPIADAVADVKPLESPNSTEREHRYQQLRYLLRSPVGTTVKVTFENPGGHSQTAVMTSVDETDSLFAGDTSRYYDPYALPVETYVPDPQVGYVRVNSNYDDLNLILRLFERALKTFEEAGVKGVIIDLRENSGGADLGYAAFLSDEDIPMGQLEYYSDKTGKFEPEGVRGLLTPNERTYHFDTLITLVDRTCYSACEIEAYSLSQVKDMIVMGMNPTAGVEAEVARGQFKLPEGLSLQAPTGRYTLPDGSIFLEGKGVEPTVRIPIDEQNLLDEQQRDVVFWKAVDVIKNGR